MSLFKRFSATVYSQLDQAIGQIENHDAVVDASVRDARHAAARAKVRLARVRAGGQRLRARLQAARESEVTWTERALRAGGDDEETALECVRRRRQCRRQIAEIEAMLARHDDLERQLSTDAEGIESRIRDITQQRDLMRARQSTAEAKRAIRALDTDGASQLDDTFERWEVRVTESELAAGSLDTVDHLEREFLDAEDREALRADLRDLLQNKEG